MATKFRTKTGDSVTKKSSKSCNSQGACNQGKLLHFVKFQNKLRFVSFIKKSTLGALSEEKLTLKRFI